MKKFIKITDKISPSIDYEGCVQVEYYKRGKLIKVEKHNEGLTPLFTGIVSYLAGLPNADYYIPKAIQGTLRTADGDNITAFVQNVNYNTQPLLFNSSEKQTTGKDACIVQYSFLIQASYLTNNNGKIVSLTLLNDNGDELARVEFDDKEQISTNIASNIIIYWKLKLHNATEVTE